MVQEGELQEIFVSSHEFGAYYTYQPDSGTFNFTSQMSNSIIFSPQYPPNVSDSTRARSKIISNVTVTKAQG